MGQSVLAAAGAGLSIAGGISSGIAQKTAGQIQTFRLQRAAEAGRVRATQVDASFRDELNDVMQTIGAIRSTQNVGFDSPTSQALYDKAESNSRAARQVAVSNERLKALGLEADAADAWNSSKSALTSSLFKSAGGAISSLSKFSAGDVAGFFKG